MDDEAICKTLKLIDESIDSIQEKFPDVHPVFFCSLLMQRACDIALIAAADPNKAEEWLKELLNVCVIDCKANLKAPS
jgi:hypothetical protein